MRLATLTKWWSYAWQLHAETKDLLRFFSGKKKIKAGKLEKGQTKEEQPKKPPKLETRQKVGLILGPLLFLLILIFGNFPGMGYEAKAVLASTVWIATWWVTEAIPIPATSLLPIILFPITKVTEVKDVTADYGDTTIFLFMGGFIVALAMEKWNLHKRIALTIISWIGTKADRIVLGTMAATGFLSMWISNTATAMMMVPIGLAIIYQFSAVLKDHPDVDTSQGNFPFGNSMMLGIAYAASIGGLGTLIGTPPNAIFAAQVKKLYNVEVSFATWMLIGVPIVIILLALTWLYLVKIAFPMKVKEIPGGKEVIQKEIQTLGKTSSEEKMVMVVFTLTALAWITRDFLLDLWIPGIDDTMIAIVAAVVLFLLPAKSQPGKMIMDWDTAKKLPWGILLLFGGGLAIAGGFKDSGLTKWIGEQLTGLQGVSFILVLTLVVTLVIFLTEITSNTATATMMFPIMAAFASAIAVHPYGLMVGAGLAASCAFMLPVATPPNAVVFGSGYVRIGTMAKAGFWLNIISIIVIVLAIYFIMPPVWGIDLLKPMK
ncbi:SLC13 family permease [Thermoflavimicrobium daqui]|jgi:sodium-dependent dicarboxylate transporter 2/3/5|uniref:Sodium-dependent dicarboxylate transporter SdcS n=1 Tax=Thermoflavimicrobium daqui TaxID=2137476 RepID=A0A364K2Z0_9BACL|nr:DASS family sodium-coupled anion symporter [Thermoflavimicrobium daqui]RAL22711.1 anion transporter [Thermoflavimicrobium daqui]